MGGPGPTSPTAIINYVELVLSIIVAGLIGDLTCFSCGQTFSKNQFIDAGVYGYLIINIIIVASIFVGEEISKKTRLAIAGIGVLVWVTAGALILEFVDDNSKWLNSKTYDRSLAAGILSIACCVSYIVDAFFVFKQ